MIQQRCLLCGREYSTGLHVMGCLICFPCEKNLLNQAIPCERRKLLKLYEGKQTVT